MPLGFKAKDGDKVGGVNQGFVFGPVFSIQVAVVRALGEELDPGLHLWIDSESDETPRRLRVEA